MYLLPVKQLCISYISVIMYFIISSGSSSDFEMQGQLPEVYVI